MHSVLSDTRQESARREGTRKLILGAVPLKTSPEDTLIAGPWCFTGREDFFPDWEDKYVFAPEPFQNRDIQAKAIAEAEALAADSIPRLAKELCPGSSLPEDYWETLLAPFAINTACIIADVWYRVQALIEAEGDSPLDVELLPESSSFLMGTDADVILRGALNPVCVHWIFSMLLRPVCPRPWSVRTGAYVSESYPVTPPQGLRARLRDWARRASLCLPVPPLKGISLARSLRWSMALMHTSSSMDGSRSLRGHFSSAATGAKLDLPVDPMRIYTALLPQTIRDLKHPRDLRHMSSPKVRIASIHLYEDAAYRQKIAVWRGRGGRIVYLQHGGNYGMMKHRSAAEFVEYSQHAFITWGWTQYDGAAGARSGAGTFLPLPSPQLAHLRDAWQGGGVNILFVGTEMPSFGYQLDSHPTPLQNVQYREEKLWMLEALGKQRRDITLYRPYFPVPGTLDDAIWLLPQFSHVHLCSGELVPQILRCRLLVLDHHGTTLLEAMAANVPTICYWNPSHWPVSPAFQKVLLTMSKAGIWHSSPESAGEHINEIWPFLPAWWQSPKVQAARQEFLKTFALCPPAASVDKQWLDTLHRL